MLWCYFCYVVEMLFTYEVAMLYNYDVVVLFQTWFWQCVSQRLWWVCSLGHGHRTERDGLHCQADCSSISLARAQNSCLSRKPINICPHIYKTDTDIKTFLIAKLLFIL